MENNVKISRYQDMDLSRVLVVVFSMFASELSHVHTKPIDFVCKSEARRVMNKAKELQEEMGVCSTIDTLPSPIHLPCVKINKATWDKKSLHERRAEILQSLEALAQDVRSARMLSQHGCGWTLLERLEHNINNYLRVVKLLHIEQGAEDRRPVKGCPDISSKDLRSVLKNFNLLLSGKLELLIAEIARTTQECQTEN